MENWPISRERYGRNMGITQCWILGRLPGTAVKPWKIDQPSNPPPHIHNAFCQTRAFWGRWGQGLGSVFLIVGVHFWRLIWPRTIGLPPFVKSRTYAKLIALKES